MEISEEDRGLIQKLKNRIDSYMAADATNERYYRGAQNIGSLGLAVDERFRQFAFPLNWCRTYVDVLCERMDVRMLIRTGDISEDPELRRDWERNDLDTESLKFARDLLVLGRAALSVAADPDGDRPIIRVESPKSLAVEVDPVTRETVAALRTYKQSDGRDIAQVLYRPNYTIYTRRVKGEEVAKRIDHGLGRVPIVMAFNRDTSDDWFHGETQLADLKPLVNMAGRVVMNLQVAIESTATPQKVATGVSKQDLQDENGKPVKDPWEVYLGAMLVLGNKDAKVYQLDGASLSGYLDSIKMLAEQASTVTGLPVRMMGQNSVNPAAEGAIRADESRLVKQVERINRTTGKAYAWALGVAERIRTRTWDSDGNIAVIFHDPGTPTEAQKADAMQKYTGGKPMLSVRGALNEMGFSQARIDREIQWLQDEENGLDTQVMGKLGRIGQDLPTGDA